MPCSVEPGYQVMHTGVSWTGALLLVVSVSWGVVVRAEDVRARPGESPFSAEVPATANELPGRSQNSPVLVANPIDPDLVALAHRVDAPEFDCALQLSGDGGKSWIPARPVPELPTGAERCYAPEIAFDSDGVLYYLFVGLHGEGNNPMGVFLTTSSDRGRTFSPPQQVMGPDRYMVRMAIDRDLGAAGRLHLVWLEAGGDPPLGGLPATRNPILASYSDDAGRTFSSPTPVGDPERRRVVAPALAIGADHEVHVLYYDLQDDARDYQGLEGPSWGGPWSLVSSSSFDGGKTFVPGPVVDDALLPPGRVMLIFTMPPPSLVVDEDGRLFAAWHDDRNGDWDVFLSRSTDGGETWSGPLRLNDDRLGNTRYQYLPRLSVAPGGRIDAIFYDRRNDLQNLRNDVFFTSSSDHGVTFAPNGRLTTESSSTTVGQRYAVPSAEGLVEFGSRLGLLSHRSSFLAAWTDTRKVADPQSQNIFVTDVAMQPAAGWIGPGVVAIVLFGLGAAIGYLAFALRLRFSS